MLAALKRESETDKKDLAAAHASLSQLALKQASDQIGTDDEAGERLRAEIEALAAENEALKAENKHLKPYERLYREAKAKSQAANDGDADAPAAVRKAPADASRKH